MDRIDHLTSQQILKELQSYEKYSGKTQEEIKSKISGINNLRTELKILEKEYNRLTTSKVKSPKGRLIHKDTKYYKKYIDAGYIDINDELILEPNFTKEIDIKVKSPKGRSINKDTKYYKNYIDTGYIDMNNELIFQPKITNMIDYNIFSHLSMNDLISLYNTNKMYYDGLNEQDILNMLSVKYQLPKVNSFSNLVLNYEKRKVKDTVVKVKSPKGRMINRNTIYYKKYIDEGYVEINNELVLL
jgi:hypothetical protein